MARPVPGALLRAARSKKNNEQRSRTTTLASRRAGYKINRNVKGRAHVSGIPSERGAYDGSIQSRLDVFYGDVAEWFKAAVLKTADGATRP